MNDKLVKRSFVLRAFLAFILLFASLPNIAMKVATINIRVETNKDSLNPWNIRKTVLINFIIEQDLDVVCLQEVLKKQNRDVANALSNYSRVGIGRTKRSSEMVPIYYKTDKYGCIASGTFWLSETPDSAASKGWDAKYPRIATWVKLRNKSTGEIVCVMNTHLDHVGKTARVEGMRVIKKRMTGIASGCPIILAGDMNCTTEAKAYNVTKEEDVQMVDTYDVAELRDAVDYTYHNYGNKKKRHRSDFIFVTPQVKVKRVLIPKEEQVNGVYMSDHCPVVAELEF